MKIEADNPEEYIQKVPEERKEPIKKLRSVVKENLPEGFEEVMIYNMIGYVVPHSLYPDGYHVTPELPLPFINIASQKNHIAVYHSGVYANDELMNWFKTEYSKRIKTKLDMGKSCIRFRNPDHIPYELIGELAGKMTPQEWIGLYEKNIKG
ncbi:DUF1801 domain-containing protein [Gracilimonas sp.]|uniref:DUF1801 domain-containing protein n=1 Tax=Gracilimonas sp. TaxID=1974203 RepID=UPI003BAB31A4